MKIVDITGEYVPFMFNSWLMSFKKCKFAGVVTNNQYFTTYRATIEDLISRGATVKFAVDSNNESRILGWICYEDNCLHYIYVKDPYLTWGVADALMTESGLGSNAHYTFKYRQVEQALPNGIWSPEIARRKDYDSGR